MDNLNADKTMPVTAESAEAENKIAAADTGKFGSVEALLKAYRELEAEFTRRSQRLKELESGSKALNMPQEGAPSRADLTEGELMEAVKNNENVKNAVIADYLKSVAANKSVPLITGGIGSAAPRNTPKTLKEAGALVREYLKNGKEN